MQCERCCDGKRHYKKVTIGRAADMATRDARVQAKAMLAKIGKGELIVAPRKIRPSPT